MATYPGYDTWLATIFSLSFTLIKKNTFCYLTQRKCPLILTGISFIHIPHICIRFSPPPIDMYIAFKKTIILYKGIVYVTIRYTINQMQSEQYCFIYVYIIYIFQDVCNGELCHTAFCK